MTQGVSLMRADKLFVFGGVVRGKSPIPLYRFETRSMSVEVSLSPGRPPIWFLFILST